MVTSVGVSSLSSSASQLSTEKVLDDRVAVACRRYCVQEMTGCETVARGSIRVCVGTIHQPGSSVVSRPVGAGGVGGTSGCGWKSGTL